MNKFRKRRGFTILEVAIFLAITGLLLIGVLGTVNIRVAAQRYNDAVQDLAEFVRRAYSAVINVENSREDIAFNQNYCSGPVQTKALQVNSSTEVINQTNQETHAGRSVCAIYGKLITFGEDSKSSTIHMYTLVGEIQPSDSGSNAANVLDALTVVGADAYAFDYGINDTQCIVASAGSMETYNPSWGAEIYDPDSESLYSGALIIVRSPISGAIHTYKLKNGNDIHLADQMNLAFACGGSSASIISKNNEIRAVNYYLKQGDFESADLDICVESPDRYATGGARRDIRVLADGRNASAVELISTDTGDSRCVD